MIDRIVVSLAVISLLFAAYRLFQMQHRAKATQRKAPAPAEGSLQPSLLYFWSEHCVPCVTQAHFLRQIPEQVTRQIRIEQIDAESDREMAARYGVFTLPTTMLVDREGSVRHVNYGLTDARILARQLESVL